MRILGNLLWLILAGFWLAIGYATSGILLCLTVVGLPFGIQAFKLAGFTLWPFGRKVVEAPGGSGCLCLTFNIFWLVLFGWELFLGHLASGVLLCATIVGIPFGLQAFKLSILALWPFGQQVVDS